MDAKKVDVLAVFDELISFEERHAEYEPRANHEAREARDVVAELLDVVVELLPYVVSDTLEHCDGNKCRESWCIGCSGDEYAEESVAKANAASSKAYALLKRLGAPA